MGLHNLPEISIIWIYLPISVESWIGNSIRLLSKFTQSNLLFNSLTNVLKTCSIICFMSICYVFEFVSFYPFVCLHSFSLSCVLHLSAFKMWSTIFHFTSLCVFHFFSFPPFICLHSNQHDLFMRCIVEDLSKIKSPTKNGLVILWHGVDVLLCTC